MLEVQDRIPLELMEIILSLVQLLQHLVVEQVVVLMEQMVMEVEMQEDLVVAVVGD